MQTMLKDLIKLTRDAAPKGDNAKSASMSSTKTLRNYWANSEQYQGAIERAQRYINEKYSSTESLDMLSVFNDWLSGSGINTWNLVGKALKENGVKYNDILMSSWQDKTQLLDRVTKSILADTDLTAEEAAKASQAISDKFYDELGIRAQKKIEQIMNPKNPSQKKNMMQKIDEFMGARVCSTKVLLQGIGKNKIRPTHAERHRHSKNL